MIDLSEESDPIERKEKIDYELSVYDADLVKRAQIIVGNKCDLPESAENRKLVEAYCKEKGYPFFALSALQNEGIRSLIRATYELLQTLPPLTVYEAENTAEELDEKPQEDLRVTRADDGAFVVTAPNLERFLYTIDPYDRESMMYFQRTLKRIGVIDALLAAGAKEGDTVRIYEVEFEYLP